MTLIEHAKGCFVKWGHVDLSYVPKEHNDGRISAPNIYCTINFTFFKAFSSTKRSKTLKILHFHIKFKSITSGHVARSPISTIENGVTLSQCLIKVVTTT